MVKTPSQQLESLFFNRVTIKRVFNGNRMQVYYMMVEIAVVQFHICTMATVQFYIFF